jgi:hypothetical protein
VGANWVPFGTSGHIRRPPGLVTENYVHIWRAPRARRTIKSIVSPHQVVGCDNPHFCWYRDGKLAVDERKRPIEGPDYARTDEVSRALLRVNHYWTKSEEEFREKLTRRRSDSGDLRRQVEPRPGDDEDDAILQYLPALREAVKAAP